MVLLLFSDGILIETYASRLTPKGLNEPWKGSPKISNESEGDIWALLVAGSSGYGNYRHQADVAHAYHVLRRGGVPAERIVTMMYDDVANHPMNPRPGTLINRPNGADMRQGMRVDYRNKAVTVENFLTLLSGNGTIPSDGQNASGRTINSGPNDHIFVYYSDHGAPGVLGMPNGSMVYADDIHRALLHRAKLNGFSEMTLFIEACESGSIFKGLLEVDLGIFAVTAANSHESSWGTYCPGSRYSPPVEYLTCLGDLFSVSWMEDAESSDLTQETLRKMFKKVRQRTSQNFTYSQGSHVERFGEIEISNEMAAEFLGDQNNGPTSDDRVVFTSLGHTIAQREADLIPLRILADKGNLEAAQELEKQVTRRAALDSNIYQAIMHVLHELEITKFEDMERILGKNSRILFRYIENKSLEYAEYSNELLASVLVSGEIPALQSLALVDDWGCLRGMVAMWESSCGSFDEYGMKHTRAFSNLCNIGINSETLGNAANFICKQNYIVVQ